MIVHVVEGSGAIFICNHGEIVRDIEVGKRLRIDVWDILLNTWVQLLVSPQSTNPSHHQYLLQISVFLFWLGVT